MFDFIENHKRLVVSIAIAIILLLLVILLFMQKNRNVNTNSNISNNELDYKFLQADISEQDKYLMLLAKIAVEDYGTYSDKDTRSLQNLKNQSIEDFAARIQEKIDAIPKGTDITTIVNPDSISLIDKDIKTITMDATTTNNVTKEQTIFQYTVTFVEEGDYWLVVDLVNN